MSLEDGALSPLSLKKVFTKRKTVVLSTTAKQIVKTNPDRVGLYITNNETINCRADESVAPTATEGFPLDAAGGAITLNTRDDGDLPSKEWFAIADSGTPTIRVKEIIKRAKELA